MPSVPPTIVGTAITLTDITPKSRKLKVRFSDVSNFLWKTENEVGYTVNIETELVRATTLLDYAPRPALVYPKKKKPGLLAAPKLVLDQVTRYLSWEHMTWEQKAIDETEARMTGRNVWGMLGMDMGAPGGDETVYGWWAKEDTNNVNNAVGWPAQYMGQFPPAEQLPPYQQFRPMRPPRAQKLTIDEPIAVYNKSAVLRAMEVLGEKKKEG